MGFTKALGYITQLWMERWLYFANANLEALAFAINESFCSIVGILLLLFGLVCLEVFFSYEFLIWIVTIHKISHMKSHSWLVKFSEFQFLNATLHSKHCIHRIPKQESSAFLQTKRPYEHLMCDAIEDTCLLSCW